MIRSTENNISPGVLWLSLGLVLSVCLAPLTMAQTSASPGGSTGVIRLRVRVATGDGIKAAGLSRKRFFLIKGSLEQNTALVQTIEQQPVISRDCYYRSIGASEALISWLKQKDCESVYCREVEQRDVEGAASIPEFQRAVAAGEKEFGSKDLARKWLAVNLSEDLRSGFYAKQQQKLRDLINQAEESSRAKVGPDRAPKCRSRSARTSAVNSEIRFKESFSMPLVAEITLTGVGRESRSSTRTAR